MKIRPEPRRREPGPGASDDPVHWELTVAFLRYTIVSVLAASLLIGTALLLFAPHQHARIVLSLAFGVLALVATLLYMRGRIKAAFLILGGGIWGLILLAMFLLGGAQTAIAQMIPLIILLAGWLINTKVAVAVAILSSLAIFSVSLLEQFALLPAPTQLIPAVRWIIPAFVFGLAAVLINHFVRSYRERLVEVRGLGDELARRSAELQVAAADLNRAQAIARVGSWVYDIPADTMWLSPETCRIFGVGEGMRGSYSAYVSRAHPEDREALEGAWRTALANGESFAIEHRITVEGGVRWVRQRAEIEFGPEGSPVRAVGTTYDFTDRKVAEEALLLQGERLRIGQTVARMIVMDWEVATDTLTWSDSPEWLRGPLPPGGKYPFYKDQVHPDDLEMWLASRRDWVNNLAGDSIDYRLVRTDGQVLWLHSRRTVITGPDGKAARMLVALHDVTERKHAEQELRASEARFRGLIELSSDWYWEQDAELRFVSTSGRGSDRGGLTAEDHLGRRRWELPKSEIVGQSWDEHRAVLAARRPFRDLLLKRTADDGGIHYVSVAGEPVFDAAGEFSGYRGVATEVTLRVMAEQQARAADERLRFAIEHLTESIAIMDSEDRIVTSNRRFRELNGNTSLTEPGHLYEDHIRAGIALGNYPEAAGREEAWLKTRIERHRAGGRLELKRQDGRWLQVTDQRLPDGGMISFALDITASKEAELALAQSESRFRDFASASGEWFWETDASGRYSWVSESLEGVSQLTTEKIIGADRVGYIAGDADLAGEPWASHLQKIARREPFRDFRYPRNWPTGRHWVSTSGVPRFDANGAFLGYRGVGTDVTAEVEVARRARVAEDRLRSGLEELGEMICLTDADDRIVLGNRRFVEFNASVAEYLVPGRRYDEHLRAGIRAGLFPEAGGREEAWVAERMAHRRAPSGPVERLRQDGRWLLVDDQVLPDGSIITWGLEITERKRAEEALRNINADLERRVADRTAQLEATNRELESFSYSVSHDLRAPLRAVTGFAKILLEAEGPKLSDEGRRYLGVIDANGRRMGSLIDALLALGRYSRVALNRSEVDMARLAREACDELAPAWPAAKISVGALPPAMGNVTLLKQVFLNLVGNALKYSANVEAPCVEIRAEGGAYVVSDNGVGFDMTFADKLFKPFERLHSEREFQGTGIGLAIVKLIVERHGGRTTAQGAHGRGADFSFTIPGEP